MHSIHVKGDTNSSVAHGKCAVLGSKICQGERDNSNTYSFFLDTFQSNNKICNETISEIPVPNSYVASLCFFPILFGLTKSALSIKVFLEVCILYHKET